MYRAAILGFSCVLLAAAVPAERGGVTGGRIDYRGWPGAYRLSNGTVELVYVPQVGRIMRYAYFGGKNVLWENEKLLGQTPDPQQASKEWVNFGGDKLWPAPQDRWGRPPDPHLDGVAEEVRLLGGNRLSATGQVSPRSGIRFIREIALARSGTGVTLKNTLVNVGARPVEWSVWEVAQVDDPEVACLPVHREGRFPAGYFQFKDNPPDPALLTVRDGDVCLRRHPTRGAKIGGDSPAGWTSAMVGGVRFQVSARYEPGREYPDGGCAQEIWSNPDPYRYMELELLSPLQTIPAGGSYSFTTRWRLERGRAAKR